MKLVAIFLVFLLVLVSYATFHGFASAADELDNPADLCKSGDIRPCGTNVGECVSGFRTCTNGQWSACTGEVTPSVETCDSKDNDCDGQVDNNCELSCTEGDIKACGSNIGECISGFRLCSNGAWGECTSQKGPSEEICDNKDNNCDGQVDENNICDKILECEEGQTRKCGSNIGACSAGLRTCTNGQWSACTREIGPTEETCDNEDNNCNGVVDEGCPDKPEPTPEPGPEPIPEPEPEPTPEPIPTPEPTPVPREKVQQKVLQELETKQETRVIVKFKESPKNLNIKQTDFKNIKSIDKFQTGVITSEGLDTLISDPDIVEVHEDQPLSLLLSDSIPLIRADLASYNLSLNGSGQKICVLDTGVDYSVITSYMGGYDFINDDPDPMDDHGHGTEVAYIIQSIAPGADILAVKVIDSTGNGYESDVLEGLQYCIDQGADIISFSIGSGSYSGFCDTNPVAELANDAISQGIFISAATGNDGSTNLKAPSCASGVTRVSASTKWDKKSISTNLNIIVDMFAPGYNITTKTRGGSDKVISGTSASSPMVSAGAAILLENESLTPDQLKYRFRSTGIPIEYTQDNLTINVSRLDVYNTIINNITMIPYDYFADEGSGIGGDYGVLGLCDTTSECSGQGGITCYRKSGTVNPSTSWQEIYSTFSITEEIITDIDMRMCYSFSTYSNNKLRLIPSSTYCGNDAYSSQQLASTSTDVISSWYDVSPTPSSGPSTHQFCTYKGGGTLTVKWAEVRVTGGSCDSDETLCETNAACGTGNTFIFGSTDPDSDCCQAGEYWDGTFTDSCCCNKNEIAAGADNEYCFTNNKWCDEDTGTYCTASDVYFQGQSESSNLVCPGVCGSDQKHSNYICDDSADGDIDGICGQTTLLGGYDCIGTDVYEYSNAYIDFSVSWNPTTEIPCDTNVLLPLYGFTRDGTMVIEGNGPSRTCATEGTEVCFDDNSYRTDCSA
ncbi:MAG: S8 family serine peptidase, partial [Nanoarchaeota archaeon]|nr:S8 family serine peptidase [Nanoarchaeota archaeon]